MLSLIVPYVSRLFIKTGIAYLIVTFIAGAVLLWLEAIDHPAPFVAEIEHGHAGFVGWLVNTVIGVAYWLLPVNRGRFPATQGRYPEALARASFYALNIGLLLRLLGEPLLVMHRREIAVALEASAVLQVGGVAAFGWIAWQRVMAPALRPHI
jgi:hypothetical protein